MDLRDFKKIDLPDSPGVYFFKEGKKNSKILYIGKATSLKDRVRSYFSDDLIKTRGPAIVDMVTKSETVTFEKTDSVLEAIILESNLIKKHKPKYNTKEKDDKSYNKIIITDEEYPRILIVREKDLKTQKKYKIKDSFGPYPNAKQLDEALKIIRKIFPFFNTKKPVNELTKKDQKNIGLKFSVGVYPDIFNGKVSKREYLQNIKNIKNFLDGKKSKIIKDLERQMKDYSNKQEFEKANQIKSKIFSLNHINDIRLIKEDIKNYSKKYRIEAFDVAHLSGQSAVGVMIVFEDDREKKEEYKKFILRETKSGDDYAGLQEILRRRLKHTEWSYPDLIVIDGGRGQKNAVTKIIKGFDPNIEIVSVVKDDKHKAKEILGSENAIKDREKIILKANLEAHRFAIGFHRNRLRKRLK